MVKINSIEFVYEKEEISHITCHLNNKKLFDVELDDFFFYLLECDDNLNQYSKNFETWESFINDLKTLSYDFKDSCENYINSQFTHTELEEFTYTNI